MNSPALFLGGNEHRLLTAWGSAYWQNRQSVRPFRQKRGGPSPQCLPKENEWAAFERN